MYAENHLSDISSTQADPDWVQNSRGNQQDNLLMFVVVTFGNWSKMSDLYRHILCPISCNLPEECDFHTEIHICIYFSQLCGLDASTKGSHKDVDIMINTLRPRQNRRHFADDIF